MRATSPARPRGASQTASGVRRVARPPASIAGGARATSSSAGLLDAVGLALLVALVLLVLGAHVRALWTGEKQFEAAAHRAAVADVGPR